MERWRWFLFSFYNCGKKWERKKNIKLTPLDSFVCCWYTLYVRNKTSINGAHINIYNTRWRTTEMPYSKDHESQNAAKDGTKWTEGICMKENAQKLKHIKGSEQNYRYFNPHLIWFYFQSVCLNLKNQSSPTPLSSMFSLTHLHPWGR